MICGRTLLMKSPASFGSSFINIESVVRGTLWRSLLLPYMITTLINIDRNMQKTTTQMTRRVVLAWMAPVSVSLVSSRTVTAGLTSMSISPSSAQWPVLPWWVGDCVLAPTSHHHLPLSRDLAPFTEIDYI